MMKVGTNIVNNIKAGALQVNKIYLGAQPIWYPYPIDVFSNTTGAWSLRRLSSAATYSVKIQRSSDSAETNVLLKDFGSIALDSLVSAGGTLTAWAGTDDVYVTLWYDQSGYGVDLLPLKTLNAALDLGQIMSSGAIMTDNGNPALFLNGNSGYYYPSPYLFWSGGSASVIVASHTTGSNANFIDCAVSNQCLVQYSSGNVAANFGTTLTLSTVNVSSQSLISTTSDGGTNATLRVNEASVSGNAGGNNMSGITVGRHRVSNLNYLNGYVSEIMVYNANKSAEMDTMLSLVNDFYSIY